MKDPSMKTTLVSTCLAALVATAAFAQEAGLVTSFGIDDVIVMNRTATAFQGESGPAHGAGHVEYFVCRGRAFDALAPDLRAALDGYRAVCIGQYKSDGVHHRVLYTVDDPPVRLGVFRQVETARWIECTGGVPLPDPAEPPAGKPLPSLDDPRYGRAAEIGGELPSRTLGDAAVQVGADTLWQAIIP